MKIGIVSDSHGDMQAIDMMLAHPAVQGVERWFFAGDVLPDAEYLALATNLPVEKVAGNNDWPDVTIPDTRVIEAAGHRILLTHGHLFGVSYTTHLVEQAADEVRADIIIYGHTHMAELVQGEVTVLNPGSIARPRDERSGSFMVAELVPQERPVVKLVRL